MSKTKSILKRFAKALKYTLLTDLKVKAEGTEHSFDHVLVGNFGVLCVRVIDEMGEVYGSENDQNFVVVDRKLNRTKTENYVKKSMLDGEVLRKIISKEKIYNVKIDTLIAIDNKLCKPMISAPNCVIVHFNQLAKLLNSRYDKEDKTDVNAVLAALENAK